MSERKCDSEIMIELFEKLKESFDDTLKETNRMRMFIEHIFSCRFCLKKAVDSRVIIKILENEYAREYLSPYLVRRIREDWHTETLMGNTRIPFLVFTMVAVSNRTFSSSLLYKVQTP